MEEWDLFAGLRIKSRVMNPLGGIAARASQGKIIRLGQSAGTNWDDMIDGKSGHLSFLGQATILA